jgi:hypothetical protein
MRGSLAAMVLMISGEASVLVSATTTLSVRRVWRFTLSMASPIKSAELKRSITMQIDVFRPAFVSHFAFRFPAEAAFNRSTDGGCDVGVRQVPRIDGHQWVAVGDALTVRKLPYVNSSVHAR